MLLIKSLQILFKFVLANLGDLWYNTSVKYGWSAAETTSASRDA